MPATYRLYSTTGTPVTLTSGGTIQLLTSPRLHHPPPPFIQKRGLGSFESGEYLTKVSAGTSLLTLGLKVVGADTDDLYVQNAALAGHLDPTQGNGYVRIEVTRPGGAVREINAMYRSGLELNGVPDDLENVIRHRRLLFEAHDPYWYPVPVVDTTTNFVAAAATDTQTIVVANNGTAPTWPLWSKVEDASGLTFHNLTTGRAMSWQNPTLTTSVVEFETREGARDISVRDGSLPPDNGDGLYYGRSRTTWDPFPLIPGDNTISVSFTGASVGNGSFVQLRHWDRFLTC